MRTSAVPLILNNFVLAFLRLIGERTISTIERERSAE